MKNSFDKNIKIDIAFIVVSTILACVYIGCMIVISLSGKPVLDILGQCAPWFILTALATLFVVVFIGELKRDIHSNIEIEEVVNFKPAKAMNNKTKRKSKGK